MKKLLWVFAVLPFLIGTPVKATEPTSDCVIRDFEGNYTLNKDSTLSVLEFLKVDCDSLPGKHGIFRILPTQVIRPEGDYNQTKIDQISITNEANDPYRYETIRDSVNHTLTWKIGDPGVTISGISDYKIEYVVHNATYDQDGKTIFNWNLNGNFWQLPTDHFLGTISFPPSLKTTEISTKLYDGVLGSTTNNYSKIDPPTDNNLGYRVESLKTLPAGVGITLNSSFPAGTVAPYRQSFLERYGAYLWFVLPLFAFLFLYMIWRRNGRDPKLNMAEMVQYAPPGNMRPLEAGLLDSTGRMKNQYLTAVIIDLAVRGYLKIEELPKQLLSAQDYKLTLLKVDEGLSDYERTIITQLFGSLTASTTTNISDQKMNFYTAIGTVKAQATAKLQAANLIDKNSLKLRAVMVALGAIIIFGGFFLFSGSSGAVSAVALTGLITLLFGLIMDRRTPEGAKAFWELKGFKLYMDKVESYRDKFYEQENIFEKYLPYAVAFGMTGKWIKSCKGLYQAKNIVMPLPIWYVGGANFGIGNIDSAISSLSSQMGSSLASTPGGSGGGGGFSGGGGGGGGGGSW